MIFHEHECLQPCRTKVPWNILHRYHYSLPPTVSVQGKCRSEKSKNRMGDHDLRRSILQAQSIFHGLVSMKMVFLDSNNHIETYIDVVV